MNNLEMYVNVEMNSRYPMASPSAENPNILPRNQYYGHLSYLFQALFKIPEGLVRAQELQRETAKESPESASGAKVQRPKDGLDGGSDRHWRDLLDECEHGDHEERRAKGLQDFEGQA